MKAAFVVFDGMTALDFVGFYDPVTRLRSMKIIEDFEWHLCSTTRQVADDRGLRIEADAVGGPLDAYDMVFVPGGFGTRELQNDRAFVEWLKAARSVPLKVSVCTGALLLGAAGFLRGHRATTHPSAYKELESYCDEVVREREWSMTEIRSRDEAFRLRSTWVCMWRRDWRVPMRETESPLRWTTHTGGVHDRRALESTCA